MPSTSQLVFQHSNRSVRRRDLRAFLADVSQQIGGGTVTCLISNDEELRRLNRKFRKKDYATDVLSFPASDGLGELAISLDRAAAQAEEMGHSLEEELRILILHGVLHLTGMDHERDNGAMAKAEARWRRRLRLPTGLIERANA